VVVLPVLVDVAYHAAGEVESVPPVRQPRPSRSEATSTADRNVERLLVLLGEQDMTIAALHAHGIRSPAQSVYDLQLAGYPIDRFRLNHDSGRSSVQYRLSARQQFAHPRQQLAHPRQQLAHPRQQLADD